MPAPATTNDRCLSALLDVSAVVLDWGLTPEEIANLAADLPAEAEALRAQRKENDDE